MNTNQVMKTHQQPHIIAQWGQPSWEVRDDGYRHCSYCGSMHVDDVLSLMVKTGTRYSGSDWKYGWPHKFYVAKGKFYAEHLLDATDDQLVLWNRVVAGLVGVKYSFDDKRMSYAAVGKSFQTYGVVGHPDASAPMVPAWFIERDDLV